MVSILTSIKKLLGISEDDESFDTELCMHINSIFTVLNQLGVGPEEGFYISDNSKEWTDFTPYKNIELIKTYVYLKVRLLFDPPQNSFLVDSIEKQCMEYECRICIQAEQNSLEKGDKNDT